MYAEAWRKYCARDVLSPLETEIAAVVEKHPEYHEIIADDDVETPFLSEDGQINPFLHMGLHLALREQVSTDRPAGIASIQRNLQIKFGDEHATEHCMIEPLAKTLWEAQRANGAPDEIKYLERLRRLS